MSTKGEGVKKVRKTVHMVCVWPLVYWRAIYRGGFVFYDRQFFPYGLGTNGFFLLLILCKSRQGPGTYDKVERISFFFTFQHIFQL